MQKRYERIRAIFSPYGELRVEYTLDGGQKGDHVCSPSTANLTERRAINLVCRELEVPDDQRGLVEVLYETL